MTSEAPPKPRRPRKTAAAKRAPGRPAADGPDLRSRMLDAAIACYTRQGIAATALRSIAVEAGVNPALVHYYFGDKDRLLEAAIQERILPAIAILREPLAAAGGDMAQTVAAFVRGIGDTVAQHPWFPSLWVREVLCEGGALRDLLVDQIGPQLPQMLAQRFAQAQRDGQLNPDLDPRFLVVSLVGLTLFPIAGAPVWQRVFGVETFDGAALREHTIALLDRGLGCG
ncbi:TetR/AcrR family transcriptional regulator [Lysobacter silvisoli]|uniref:TetR/AcrR family transcriptional regulator n=1 Tax=Lysobacter silvisoli TaxID=2293254 RepID=A0A371K5W0_9GAMM|nr:TetR/AcrR family transcriptional regulator [Lysobacter silvisoli]RDZ29242.1 TetR/AcrR family transcriptional regulator [Lysobacter silvisoli]